MGCGYDFICKTCKKSYYLGYGSSTTWITTYEAKSIIEYKKLESNNKELQKNKNFEKCLEEHDGHEYFSNHEDFTIERNGNLYSDGLGYSEDELLIEKYDEYEKIKL